MQIPLPGLMRRHRETEFDFKTSSWQSRAALRMWAWMAQRPRLYHLATRFGVAMLGAFGRGRGAFRRLPLAGGWTRHRDLPAPQGRTFQAQWAEHKAGVPR